MSDGANGPASGRARAAALLPGSTVGILGGGQLGRMLALSARRLGYRVHVLSPDAGGPTAQVADVEIVADTGDSDAVRRFAQGVDVVTFEFENVAVEAADAAAECVPVRPAGRVLWTTQHRLREKDFLREHGFPTTRFRAIGSPGELVEATAEFAGPAVLKSAAWGYDGKGQAKLAGPLDAAAARDAWAQVGAQTAILEAFVDFECEVSVVAARGLDGAFAHWGVMLNDHDRHILDVTQAPAPGLSDSVSRGAIEIAHGILDALDVVGVLCVEFFVTRGGELLVNELAPRPHNSGHLTIEACVTSQFEQQLRAVCGLPLGSTDYRSPAAMANLLGDLWCPQGDAGRRVEPDWAAVLALPNVYLHLYGKQGAMPGRKMGHVTALGKDANAAAELARTARRHASRR